MSKRRKSKGEFAGMAIGVAKYFPEQWARLRAVVDDRHEIEETWEEWRELQRRTLEWFRREGVPVREVAVDVDALVAWCRQEARPVDGAARTAYVTHLMKGSEGQSRGEGVRGEE